MVLSMKDIFRNEILKRISELEPGQRIRRNVLRRQILADKKVAMELLKMITYEGRKTMTPAYILKRFDRVYSDALDQIKSIYLEQDEMNPRVSWIVRDEEDFS
jgi:hypothetical protein